LFEMLGGMRVNQILCTSFGGMQIDIPTQHDERSHVQPDGQLLHDTTGSLLDEAPGHDELAAMLHCHEQMDLELPLGPALGPLVLPAWLRDKFGTLSNSDWASLCEVGVAAAVEEAGAGTECVGGASDMPELVLCAPNYGFVW
jgi:hypothetical protein